MDRICQWGWPAMGTGGAFPVQSCTNSAIAWLQPPHRHCGCPGTGCCSEPPSAPASRRTRPHGSFCKYLFTFPSPPSPFGLALHKSGNWRRVFRWVSVPTKWANLEQANVKGVTRTIAAAWWCLTNSKACYTWVTVHLTCCSARVLSIAVRHATSPWFKLKHFDPDPNVYLHAFRYTDVNYQSGNKSCSEYG